MSNDKLLQDSFLIKNLNPLFFEAIKGFWKALEIAKVSQEEQVQLREALYNLVRFTFRHLFQPLYLKYTPQVKGTLFLLSAVHSDGIGDYISALKCAQLLTDHYSGIDIHVVYTHKQKLPSLDPSFSLKKENIHAFQETEDPSSIILGNILEGKNTCSFLQELEKLQNEREKILKEYESLKAHPQAALAVKELADELNPPIKQLQYELNKKRKLNNFTYKCKKA